ncbi:putative LysR family transcriptional regulator [Cronobacter sakazakii]|nr:putative LysR family transcriptional regulator [Cronobacter sakazakii]CCK13263.1 putative transcriptional regulator, LysR family [Cronobacter sakazakii 680]
MRGHSAQTSKYSKQQHIAEYKSLFIKSLNPIKRRYARNNRPALKGAPWQFVNRKGEFETIKVKGHYRVNSGEMAGRAAVAGVGFAILSKQACQPYINDGRLIEVEFEQAAAPLQLFAVYSNRRFLPAKTRAFIDFVHQRLSAMPSAT